MKRSVQIRRFRSGQLMGLCDATASTNVARLPKWRCRRVRSASVTAPYQNSAADRSAGSLNSIADGSCWPATPCTSQPVIRLAPVTGDTICSLILWYNSASDDVHVFSTATGSMGTGFVSTTSLRGASCHNQSRTTCVSRWDRCKASSTIWGLRGNRLSDCTRLRTCCTATGRRHTGHARTHVEWTAQYDLGAPRGRLDRIQRGVQSAVTQSLYSIQERALRGIQGLHGGPCVVGYHPGAVTAMQGTEDRVGEKLVWVAFHVFAKNVLGHNIRPRQPVPGHAVLAVLIGIEAIPQIRPLLTTIQAQAGTETLRQKTGSTAEGMGTMRPVLESHSMRR